MNRKDIIESLWDDSLRIDQIIWLAANSSRINRDLEDFLEDAEVAEKLLGLPVPEEADDFNEFLAELSRKGKNGYLVEASTPVRRKTKTGFSYNWGECFLKWFYFETWDEAEVTRQLHEWVNSVEKKARR